MIVLGIDTSCDETSAGLVADGRIVLSNVVQSQIKLHHPHGGVVPELASREHLRNILPVVKEALAGPGLRMSDVDAIGVTVGPGLVGSLLVGLYYAKAVAFVRDVPLAAVNHLEGHVLSIFLEEKTPRFPFVALTVSGGHTTLYHVKGYGDYQLMGQTLDDAAGEAFDKVAKACGLGYPGGKVIEEMAREGQNDRIRFPRAYLSKDSLDFSFSGLKTAVALYLKEWQDRPEDHAHVSLHDVAASFQEAVVDVLVDKTMMAGERVNAGGVVVAGGVACNQRLRARFEEAASRAGMDLFFPRTEYCTDNGAMIAAAGYHRIRHGDKASWSVDVRSKYPISDLATLSSSFLSDLSAAPTVQQS